MGYTYACTNVKKTSINIKRLKLERERDQLNKTASPYARTLGYLTAIPS
jgi:hypothetical protein